MPSAVRLGICLALVPFVALVVLVLLGVGRSNTLVIMVAAVTMMALAVAVPTAVLLALVVAHVLKAQTRDPVRQSLRPAATWAASFAATTLALVPFALFVNDQALRLVTWGAAPLVDAIHSYQQAHGTPPATLLDLVPEYLDAIPDTRMGQPFQYAVYRPTSERAYHWYDLGSREDVDTADESPFSEGDSDHGALVLITDHDKRISFVRLDRYPIMWEQRAFEGQSWREGTDRMAMARDVARALRVEGRPLNEVVAELGRPDGEGLYLTPAWELWVSGSFLMSEKLVYSPSGSYDRFRASSGVRRLGAWALIDD
ncbi:MAG: hypothetical protein ACI9EF_000292 [Pseudohongiellaceae bacterium]|jgi:hypothetical protein